MSRWPASFQPLWRRVLAVFQARQGDVLSVGDVCRELPDAPRGQIATNLSNLTRDRWLRREAAGVYRIETIDPGRPIEPFHYDPPTPMFPRFEAAGIRFMLRPDQLTECRRIAARRGQTIEEFLNFAIDCELDNVDWHQRIADEALRWMRVIDQDQRADELSWALDLLLASATDHGCAIERHLCGCCGEVKLVAADHPFDLPCPLCLARVMRTGSDLGHQRGEGFCPLNRIGFARTGRLWRPPPEPALLSAPSESALELLRVTRETAAAPVKRAGVSWSKEEAMDPLPDLPRACGRGTPVF